MGKNEDPLAQVQAEIESKFYMACVTMASDTTHLIESAYEAVIESFYDDYTPRVYKRTGSTYLASDKAFDSMGFTPVDNETFDAGITVDSNNIPGNPYRANKDWVFQRTFEQGIHGYFAWEYARWAKARYNYLNKKYVMSKARKNKLRDFFKKSYKHSPKKYIGKKITKAISTNATNLNMKTKENDIDAWVKIINETDSASEAQTVVFSTNASGWNHMTPKRYMDRDFKEITKITAMNKRFNSILNNLFAN